MSRRNQQFTIVLHKVCASVTTGLALLPATQHNSFTSNSSEPLLHTPYFTLTARFPPPFLPLKPQTLHLHRPPPEGGAPPAPEAGSSEPGLGGVSDADIQTNWDEAIETFDAMSLPEDLLRGIYAYGFEKPSAIQQRAVKPSMLGRDLIAQAQSGE